MFAASPLSRLNFERSGLFDDHQPSKFIATFQGLAQCWAAAGVRTLRYWRRPCGVALDAGFLIKVVICISEMESLAHSINFFRLLIPFYCFSHKFCVQKLLIRKKIRKNIVAK
jgi:hypothetical protein